MLVGKVRSLPKSGAQKALQSSRLRAYPQPLNLAVKACLGQALRKFENFVSKKFYTLWSHDIII
jgi:hypothetical protein